MDGHERGDASACKDAGAPLVTRDSCAPAHLNITRIVVRRAWVTERGVQKRYKSVLRRSSCSVREHAGEVPTRRRELPVDDVRVRSTRFFVGPI